MSPELHLPVFVAAVVVMQGLLALWCYRVSGSTSNALLVALLPPVGLPYQLWLLRLRIVDNHVAGALSYLALVAACVGFSVAMPPDETPWMVIHTMAIFAALGLANLVGTSLKD